MLMLEVSSNVSSAAVDGDVNGKKYKCTMGNICDMRRVAQSEFMMSYNC